jgi:hypothetical protein
LRLPHLGPPFWTLIWDLDLGHPHLGPPFGTPILDPDFGPRFETPPIGTPPIGQSFSNVGRREVLLGYTTLVYKTVFITKSYFFL